MDSFLPLKASLMPLQCLPDDDGIPDGFAAYCQFYQLDIPDTQHRIGYVDSGAYRLAAQYWLPADAARGTALLVHGYFDHMGLYGHVVRYLLDQGYAVLGFDLPGHGLSSGARAVIHDFDDYGQAVHNVLSAAAGKLPPLTLGFGQSTGCAAWMNYLMADYPIKPQQLLLFSPLLRPHRWALQGRWLYSALRHFVRYLPRSFRANSSDPTFLRFCHELDPLQPRMLTVAWVSAMKNWLERFAAQPAIALPALIVQGQRDDTVDWRYNIPVILQKMPQAQLHYLAEARHHLANESTSIRLRLWQIVSEFLHTTPP